MKSILGKTGFGEVLELEKIDIDGCEIKTLTDAIPTYYMVCPSCGVCGTLDENQFCGLTPIVCQCANFTDMTDFRKVFNV